MTQPSAITPEQNLAITGYVLATLAAEDLGKLMWATYRPDRRGLRDDRPFPTWVKDLIEALQQAAHTAKRQLPNLGFDDNVYGFIADQVCAHAVNFERGRREQAAALLEERDAADAGVDEGPYG